jgi:predicted deacylase
LKQTTFEFADVMVAPGERAFTRLPVTKLLNGSTLDLPVHIIHGAEPGPVLGITSSIHGAEYLPIRMVRGAVQHLAPAVLKGTVITIPICNPLSFARGTRVSPDEDDVDFANLNRVFPGRRKEALFGIGQPHSSDRTLTETIAAVITDRFLTRIDHVIDFHSHFQNAGLIKTIQQKGQSGRQAEITQGMCRALGLGLIHEHATTPKSLTGQAADMGISVCVAEIGGGALSAAAEEQCVALGVRGILNVMKFLGMVPGQIEVPQRQLLFEIAPHVRPTTAGYLVSRFDPDQLFLGDEPGTPVQEGEVLGTLFDPHTFEDLETLHSPVEGILYITRRSGPLEAGSHAYAVADFQMSHWVDCNPADLF